MQRREEPNSSLQHPGSSANGVAERGADINSPGPSSSPEPQAFPALMEADDVDDDYNNQDDGEERGSVYAVSTYPRVPLAHQVEYPFDTTIDDGTM